MVINIRGSSKFKEVEGLQLVIGTQIGIVEHV